MTQVINRNNTTNDHAKKQPIVGGNYNWKHNCKITDRCTQAVSLMSHRMGERLWQLSS